MKNFNLLEISFEGGRADGGGWVRTGRGQGQGRGREGGRGPWSGTGGRGPLVIPHSTPSGHPDGPPLKKSTGQRGARGNVGSPFEDPFSQNNIYSRVLLVCLGWLFFWHILSDSPSQLAST